MTTVSIALLGSLDIQHNRDGRWITPKLPRKAKCLVAFLAVRKAPVQRSVLADLLWPYQAPEQGRHSLRNCLLELRGRLGRAVIGSDFESCWLNEVATDLDELSRCGPGEEMQAAALYRGPLLDGVEIASEPWHEWVTYERDLAQDKAIEILARGADRALQEGRPEDAVSLGRRLLTIDPLYEPAHRRVMSGHDACGRAGEAARQYLRCKEVLRRELDVAPEPETVALYARICQGAVAVVVPSPPPPPPPPPLPPAADENEYEYQRGYEAGFSDGKLRGYEIAIAHLARQRDAAVARRGAVHERPAAARQVETAAAA